MKRFVMKGITLITSAPYHPEGNGLAERKIRDLKTFMALYPRFVGGWKPCLDAAVQHASRSHTASLGCSPHFKAHGKPPRLPADDRFAISDDTLGEEQMSEEATRKYHAKQKEDLDRRHPKHVPNFKKGGLLLVQTGLKGKGLL